VIDLWVRISTWPVRCEQILECAIGSIDSLFGRSFYGQVVRSLLSTGCVRCDEKGEAAADAICIAYATVCRQTDGYMAPPNQLSCAGIVVQAEPHTTTRLWYRLVHLA
jgi:hypothetical protein